MSCRAGTTLVATICTDGCSLGIKRLRTQSTGTGRSSVACSCGAFAQWKGFHGNAALRAPATATAGRFRHGSERVGHFRTPLHWETLEHPVFPYQLVKSSSIMAPKWIVEWMTDKASSMRSGRSDHTILQLITNVMS